MNFCLQTTFTVVVSAAVTQTINNDFKSSAFYRSNSVIEHDKNIYYRDVRLFCKKVQNLTVIKNEKLIWVNLNICLFDYTLVWSIAKLSVSSQIDLCDLWLENDWVKKFRLRFKSDHFADVDVLISQILDDIL